MKLKFKYTERFVAMFLGAALLVFLIALAFIIVNKKYFETKISYRAKFADANGLGPSTTIYFKGFKIGAIREFHLTGENYIEATVEIYKEYKDRIVVNSALWKGLNPVTNTSSIEFLPGVNSFTQLPPGSLLPAVDVPEGRALLDEKKVRQFGDPLSTLLANLQTFADNLTSDSITNRGPLFRAIQNFASVSEDLKGMSKSLTSLISALTNEKNPDNGTIVRIADNMLQLTDDLKKIEKQAATVLSRADTLLVAYKNPDSLGIRMLDPTGQRIMNPLRETILGVNSMLPKLEQLMTYANTKTSDLTILLEELKITLRQAQVTFDALNQLTNAGDSNPVSSKANASFNRLKYEESK